MNSVSVKGKKYSSKIEEEKEESRNDIEYR